MQIDVDKLKEQMDDDSVKVIMSTFGVSYIRETNEYILFPSMCHHIDFESHGKKLYYIKKGKYFHCHSCSSTFDVFSIVQERKKLLGENCSFPQSIKYVCEALGVDSSHLNVKPNKKPIYDWKSSLNKYLKRDTVRENKEYDRSVMNFLAPIYHQSWIDDGISIETMEKFGVKYYPLKQQICVPIFDDENKFIGCHVRNLDPIMIENKMKYYHLVTLDNQEYKFNMGSVLYGLNFNRYNIQQTRTAIIFESLKSVMIYDSFNRVNNSVGTFGMNFQKFKRDLLVKYNCENFIIALDKQYKRMYDNGVKTDEFILYEKSVMKIVDVLSPFARNIWVVYDDGELLGYKDSPVDKGEKVWDELEAKKELIYSVEGE